MTSKHNFTIISLGVMHQNVDNSMYASGYLPALLQVPAGIPPS